MFLYDKTGSALFEEITQLPEYYLTRTEIPLIKQAATDLKYHLHDIDIIEFGSGDCTKISLILDEIAANQHNTIRYIPFDVSHTAVSQSATTLSTMYPHIGIHGIVADFMTQLKVIPKERKKLFCFLGSTIGNLSFDTAQHFLHSLSKQMKNDDFLLIGFDMIKDTHILEKAYNDSAQVTEQFNKNILNVINTHINTNLNPDHFDHVSFFNEQHSRIEMHLKATKHMQIYLPDSSIPLTIKQGETIHTENSYKFTRETITKLANGAQLHIDKYYTDNNQWFSLVLLKKV